MKTPQEYKKAIRTLFSPRERRVLDRLKTPQKIQQYLDAVAINFEEGGETLMGPREVLRTKQAHCIEAAMFAAASLAYHGYPPYLMDFQTVPNDEDHVVAVFKQGNYWGAISKTNHATLRWRDPVYKTVRELAMSYFHEYIVPNGKKTMIAYSKPFDMRKYKPETWVTSGEKLDWVAEELDASPHFPAVSRSQKKLLLNASKIERSLLIAPEEWPAPRKDGKKKNWH